MPATTLTEDPLVQPAATRAADAPIRVLIAEDHRVTLWGLERLIEGTAPRMQVIGTATTRKALLEHPALPSADLVLMDMDLGGEDACETLGELLQRCRGHVLVLTGEDSPVKHREAVLHGARGLVHKSQAPETVLLAIEKVHRGEVWLERGMLGEVLGQLTGRPPVAPQSPEQHAIAQLTPRERQVIAAMTRGVGRKQMAVADELGMSEHTLRNHLTTIYSKLHLRGRLELHVFATRNGLDRDEPGPAGRG